MTTSEEKAQSAMAEAPEVAGTNGATYSDEPAPQGTDANMIVFNDNPGSITITVTNNVKMSREYPSPKNIPPGGSAAATVEASWIPGQSSFDLNFASGDKGHIEIGSWPTRTACTPEVFSSGKSAAVLAPGKPLQTGIDYQFLFFNGPGILTSLIDSFIQANFPALVAYVNKTGINIPVNDSLSLKITGISAAPNALSCIYASALPTSGDDSYIDAVFRVNKATIKGSATIKGRTGDFDLTVTSVMVWTQMTFDSSLKNPPQVKQLQMSLGDYSASGTIIEILKVLFPIIGIIISLGATAYRVAGFVNTIANDSIKNGINDAIKNIIKNPKLLLEKHESNGTPDEIFNEIEELHGTDNTSAAVHTLPTDDTSAIVDAPATTDVLATADTLAAIQLLRTTISPAPAGKDLSTWMSNPQIQAMTLGKLKIPGTHDSATDKLSSTLSQISYEDIAALFYLRPGAAPADGNPPIQFPLSNQNPVYLGPKLYDWTMGVGVNSIARTQGLSILEQLKQGIRYFDFRVYFDTRVDDFYIYHGLRGYKFSEVLAQMQNFLKANPKSAELIFANVSHTNFGSYLPKLPQLTKLIQSIIPAQNLYYQPTPAGEKQFDFQTLAPKTVGSITNGLSKIMFINGDAPRYSYTDTITNTTGYTGAPYTGQKFSVEELTEEQGPPMQKPHSPFWEVGWVLGAYNPAIVRGVLDNLAGIRTWTLLPIAQNANAALPKFFKQYGTNFNLLTVDFCEFGPTSTVAELVVDLNKS